MRKLYLALALVVVGAAALMLVLAPPAVQAKAPGDGPSTSAGNAQEADEIVCDFLCEDGYGFGYFCPDETFGECCQAGEQACGLHGGLADGICSRGRLGLVCGGI
ncbi:MAG: hypothetical protein SX243_05630 [Acidobacteriota bacterium]|nr:hypothetical protein [Acidobacteriota bacterium]